MKKLYPVLMCAILLTSMAYGQSGRETFEGRLLATQAMNAPLYPELNKALKAYTVYQMDGAALVQSVKQQGDVSHLQLKLGADKNWNLTLTLEDIFSPGYRALVGTENGVTEVPRPEPFTYRGYVNGNPQNKIAVSVRDNYISGILNVDGTSWFIEPAQRIQKGAPENNFVLYKVEDAILDATVGCGVTEMEDGLQRIGQAPPSGNETNAVRACQLVEIALAADYSMVQEFGSVAAAQTEITEILNLVSAKYEELPMELKYKIITTWISSSSGADPWSTSVNSNTLLQSFTDWGNGNGFGTTAYDVAGFWTNRDLDNSGVIGLAWVGVICGNNRYHIMEHFFSQQVGNMIDQAHEAGHNWNCSHISPANNTNIMSPTIGTGNTTWHTTSQNTIVSHRDSRSCLGADCSEAPLCDFTSDVTLTCDGTVQFTDLSGNDPTSWQWDFGDGNTSSQQNPLHTYTTPGTYTVQLTATNAKGNDTETKTQYITFSQATPPTVSGDTTICGPGAVVISANGQGTIQWFDAQTGGNVLFTGSNWGTFVSTTTTFYAGDVGNIVTEMVGDTFPVPLTVSGGSILGPGLSLIFNALKDVTLNSVDVYVNNAQDQSGPGSRTIELVDPNGAVKETKTVNLTTAGAYETITLNFKIPVGNGYKLRLATGSNDLYAHTLSQFSYTGNLIDIVDSDWDVIGNPGYPYFYNWVVTEQSCASSRVPVTVTVNALPSLTGSSVDAPCGPNCTGSATVTASGGGGAPYSYQWDAAAGNQTGQTASGLCPGSYVVTVTANGGCSDTLTVNVNSAGTLTGSVSHTDATCSGCNGTATAAGANGTTPYSYQWDNGATNQTTETASGLCPGTYSVTITDASQCTIVKSVTVSSAQGSVPNTTSSTDASCGACSGTATVTPTGGTSPYTYQWDNAATNQTVQTATGLCPGSYAVTITDATGCTGTAMVSVSGSSATINVTNSTTDASCSSCNGTATVNPTGGTSPYSYQWDAAAGNQTTQTAGNLCAGSYTVTVSDVNGCQKVANILVNSAGGNITLTTSTQDASCSACDGSATVSGTGGTTPYTYAWNDAGSQTAATASGLCAGTYVVTVTDANGCSTTSSANVNSGGSGLNATTSSTDAGCNCVGTATANPTGGVAPYTYAWDAAAGNQTTQTAGNLCAGSFNVTVTDAAGCSTTVPVTVGTTTGVNASSTKTDSDCSSCNGNATVSATGGSTPYTYQWNDPGSQTAATANGLCVGNYTVTVTDAGGCTATHNVNIISTGANLAATATKQDAGCSGSCTGSGTVTATGGTTPYTYLWSDGKTGMTASGLCAGNYSVTVTDAGGCTTTQSVTINTAGGTLTTSHTSNNATCTACNGSGTVSGTGGTPPLTFKWDNATSSTSPTVNTLCAGTYNVTVTDAAGCTSVETITITSVSSGLVATTSKVDATCSACDGTATANPSNGQTPYAYSWSNGQSAKTASGLCAGTYTVTVTDNSGCKVTQSVTVATATGSLDATTTSTVTSCGTCDGTATVSSTGGSSPFTYKWDDAASQTATTATGLCAGSYNVTVTDSKGCSIVRVANVQSSGAQVSGNTTPHDAACGICDGYATVAASGGTSPYTFLWDAAAGSKTTSVVFNLCAGTYSVTITDANGCSTTKSVTIGMTSTGVTLSKSSTNDTGPCNGSATATPSGGKTPYTYKWDAAANNQTTQTATSLCFGFYAVTVTDAAGCTATELVEVKLKTGLADLTEIGNVNLFPNPTRGLLNVKVELQNEETVDVAVMNMLGEIIAERQQTTSEHTFEFDFSGRPDGVYMVMVRAGHYAKTYKAVIAH